MAAGLLLELSLKQSFQVHMTLSLISLLSLTWRLFCVSMHGVDLSVAIRCLQRIAGGGPAACSGKVQRLD